jgi:signal transduction histidine kinase
MAIQNARLFHDVANQRSQLELANQKLKDLDRLKSAFVSNVSHELRTPLTAIESLAENMLDGITGTLTKHQATYIADIKTSADRLARLIDNVLDISVIESGKLELQPVRISLSVLVARVVDTLRPIAKARQINVEVASAESHLHVRADRDKIIQVLTNLVGNAIKFSRDGDDVRVSVRRSATEWAEVAVADTGPGIPAGELDKIFEEFYQVRPPDKEKSRGAGLGLAISKKLIEMHGGRIWVESAPGKGSCFIFSLPAEASVDSAARARQSESAESAL